MTAPKMSKAKVQWLAQLAAMRQAISEIKLEQQNSNVQDYGHDIVVDDENTDGSSDDFWDISSQGKDDEYSSDTPNNMEDMQHKLGNQDIAYNSEWLESQCAAFAYKNSGIKAGQLRDQLSALLASDMNGIAQANNIRADQALTHLIAV